MTTDEIIRQYQEDLENYLALNAVFHELVGIMIDGGKNFIFYSEN